MTLYLLGLISGLILAVGVWSWIGLYRLDELDRRDDL